MIIIFSNLFIIIIGIKTIGDGAWNKKESNTRRDAFIFLFSKNNGIDISDSEIEAVCLTKLNELI